MRVDFTYEIDVINNVMSRFKLWICLFCYKFVIGDNF